MSEQPLNWNIHELRDALSIIAEFLLIDEIKREVYVATGEGVENLVLMASGEEAETIIAAIEQLPIFKPSNDMTLMLDEDEDPLSLQRATRALEASRQSEDEIYEQHKDFYNPYGLDTDDNWRAE